MSSAHDPDRRPAADLEDTHIGLPAVRDDNGPPPPARRRRSGPRVVVVAAPLGYAVEGRGSGRRADGVRPSEAVGLDRFTPVLLLAWAVATVAVLVVQLARVPDGGPAVAAGLARSLLWSAALAKAVTFAVVVAPLCWLAVFVAGKVQRFELPPGAYLRAAGVAALPEVALLCVREFAPDNPALRTLLALSVLPLAFAALRAAFDLRLGEAAVAYGFGLAFFAVGWFASSLVIGAVVSDGLARSQGTVGAAVTTAATQQATGPRTGTAGGPPSQAAVAAAAAAAADDAARAVAATLRGRLDAMTGAATKAEQDGPERASADWRSLANDLAAAKAARPDLSEWAELDRALAAAGAKLAALPPAALPAAVFEPMPADQAFPPIPAVAARGDGVGGGASGGLGDEVAFAGFRVRPPADAHVDLELATDGAYSLVYRSDRLPARLELAVVRRANPRQQRPYAITRAYQRPAAAAQDLFVAADVADGGPSAAADVSFGPLAGLSFARVASRTTGGADPDRDLVQYVALADADHWLVVRAFAGGPQREPALAAAFEASARSLRRPRPNEPPTDPAVDPYGPARVASQFAADPGRVGDLFRRRPAEAEPFVVEFLSHSDPNVRRGAMALLPTVASKRSVARFLSLVKSSADPDVATAARATLRRVAPDEFDVAAEALMDLQAQDAPARRERALDALVAPGVVPSADRSRRDEVAGELETLALDPEAPPAVADKAARLLAAWGSAQTTARLAAALTNPNLPPPARDRLIAALADTQDRAAAAAIARCLARAPEPAVAGLVRMGPAAEDEVVKALLATFPAPAPARAPRPAAPGANAGEAAPPATPAEAAAVRQACVRVLREVGTAKSLDPLGRCLRDAARGDPAVRTAIKEAIDQVRARAAAAAKAPPATRPG